MGLVGGCVGVVIGMEVLYNHLIHHALLVVDPDDVSCILLANSLGDLDLV